MPIWPLTQAILTSFSSEDSIRSLISASSPDLGLMLSTAWTAACEPEKTVTISKVSVLRARWMAWSSQSATVAMSTRKPPPSGSPRCHQRYILVTWVRGTGPHPTNQATSKISCLVPEGTCARGDLLSQRALAQMGQYVTTGRWDVSWVLAPRLTTYSSLRLVTYPHRTFPGFLPRMHCPIAFDRILCGSEPLNFSMRLKGTCVGGPRPHSMSVLNPLAFPSGHPKERKGRPDREFPISFRRVHRPQAHGNGRESPGPQKSWLHHVVKAESAECACGHPSETGEHIVFKCPRFDRPRRALLGEKSSWEELDKPEWRKEEEETYEATEAFFGLLFRELT
ncbi:hypothetical protein BGX38DRAFT_1333566 [Terfezia claveryi]|nr:hypothetical protein BGX38DRAFT_1333566 [Terfezia claveryi]